MARVHVWIAAGLAACFAGSPVADAQTVAKKVYTTARLTGTPPAIDGRLNDECWNAVAWATGFVQSVPTEGAVPAEQTSFKILYDKENLYVAVRMHDTEPARIERRLGRRDNYSGDDVIVALDSYHDQRTAFGFGVNAAGVKWDGVTANDVANWDATWDPVWDVSTAADDGGWTAELRIPFNQLRFADTDEHVWGLEVSRGLFRKQEQSDWQPLTRRVAGYVSRFGELRGINGVRPKTPIELVPYGVGQLQRSEQQPGNPFATGQRSKVTGGIDGKIGLTNNVTLDLTVNPDFGQVEADPSVVNLTAFETFFPERRPFFVEGANIFSQSISSFGTSAGDRLFYSRRIGRAPRYWPAAEPGAFVDVPQQTRILGAVKVSGKTRNGLSLGILDTVTAEEQGTIDLFGTRRQEAVEPTTNYFVGRVQKDFGGGNTTIGAMITSVQRETRHEQLSFLHRAAYTGGFDILHQWRDKTFYARGAGVFSYVTGTAEAIRRTQMASPRYMQRPDAAYLGFDPTRTSLVGHGGSVEIGRSGRSPFLFNASVAWRSPGLELNDMGYQRVADYIVSRLQTTYNVYRPFSIFRTFRAEGAFWVNQLWNRSVAGYGGYVAVNGQLRNFWTVMGVVEKDSEYLNTTNLRGGPAIKQSPWTTVSVNLASDQRKPLAASVSANTTFDANDEAPFANVGVNLQYRPTSALSLSVRPSYGTNRQALQYLGTFSSAGQPVYLLADLRQKTASLTLRVNYALTPSLTVEFYGQPFVSAAKYSSFKRLTDPRAAEFANRFDVFGADRIQRLGSQYLVDAQRDGVTDYRFGDPDFGFRQFRSNLVLRWEYSAGSMIYVVWSQQRTGVDASGDFAVGAGTRALFNVVPTNVFMVKMSRRFPW